MKWGIKCEKVCGKKSIVTLKQIYLICLLEAVDNVFFSLCVRARVQSTASSMRFEDTFFTTQGERKRQRTPNSRFQNDYVADPSPRTSNCSKPN